MLAYVTKIPRTGCWVAYRIKPLSFFSAFLYKVGLDFMSKMKRGFSARRLVPITKLQQSFVSRAIG